MRLAMNKNLPADATPEQLLDLLESQIAIQRQKRTGSRSRSRVLGVALVLIIGAGTVAFLVLQMLLGDLAERGARTHATPQTAESRNL